MSFGITLSGRDDIPDFVRGNASVSYQDLKAGIVRTDSPKDFGNIKNEIQAKSCCFYQRHMFSLMKKISRRLNSVLTKVGCNSHGF